MHAKRHKIKSSPKVHVDSPLAKKLTWPLQNMKWMGLWLDKAIQIIFFLWSFWYMYTQTNSTFKKYSGFKRTTPTASTTAPKGPATGNDRARTPRDAPGQCPTIRYVTHYISHNVCIVLAWLLYAAWCILLYVTSEYSLKLSGSHLL